MNQGFRFSLQVGLAVAFAVMLTGGLLSWWVYQEESKAFRGEASTLAEAIAGHLSLSQDPIEPTDQTANQLALQEAAQACPRVQHIALIDKYGKFEAQSGSPDAATRGIVRQWREELSVQEVLASEKTFVFPGRWEGYYSVWSPDGVYWGKLRILWQHDRVANFVRELLFVAILTASAMGLLGLLAGMLLYRTTLSARVGEMGDRLRHIINSGFRGRVTTMGLAGVLTDLGEQVNRVLDGLDQQQKRVVILEDSLRQTESSYQELQARAARESETSEREHEIALYAFQQLFESISDGAVLTDGDGTVLALNGVAERWMHLLGQEGSQLSDEPLLRLIRRVAEQTALDRDTSTWEVPDPLRGGRAPGRATAVVLRREETGLIYMLLLLRTEESAARRDWLAPLSERFLFEELLPWLSDVLSEREHFLDVSGTREAVDRHVEVLARLSALRQIGRIGPEDFQSLPLGPWLARHLQATDLFSRMIAVRFHPPRGDCSVWTVEPVLGQVIDLLIEILLDLAEESEATSPIDLFVDTPPAGGVVLRFEIGFELSSSARDVLRAIGDDQLQRLVRVGEAEQQKWTFVQHVKIVGTALLRSLLGCRLDLRAGQLGPLCVRWTFPPGSEHGSTGHAPSFSESQIRVNRLIRNYLIRSSETAEHHASSARPPVVDLPVRPA